jgi:hypothetical protein
MTIFVSSGVMYVACQLCCCYCQVVVKPSGVMWHASCGETCHSRSDVLSIWKAVLCLLGQRKMSY